MEELNNTLASLQLDDFSSAKIKIDQLFLEWLSLEGQAVLEAIFSAEDSLSGDEDGLISSRSSDSSASQTGGSHGLGPIPPRSPTNTKKSPKKRTQSEMLNNTNPNAGSVTLSVVVESSNANEGPLPTGGERASGSSLTAKDEIEKDDENEAQISARRRSNFDSIPLFYIPGGSKQKDQKTRIRQGDLTISLCSDNSNYSSSSFLCGIPKFCAKYLVFNRFLFVCMLKATALKKISCPGGCLKLSRTSQDILTASLWAASCT